jgi:hypothetical protein
MSVKIRDGRSTIPAVITTRYEEWREEQDRPSKRVAFSPLVKQNQTRIVAGEKRIVAEKIKITHVEKQTSPAEVRSFQEQFSAMFETLKSELQSSIELAKHNPSKKLGPSTEEQFDANRSAT